MSGHQDVIYEVVSALAAVEGVAPAELEYDLYEYFNSQVLIDLFATDGDSWELSFTVPGHEVVVTHTGEIFVDGTHQRTIREGSPDGPQDHDRYHIRENFRHRKPLVANVPCMLYRARSRPGRPMEFVSDACKDVTGYPPETLMSGDISYGGDVIHPDDRRQVRESIRRALDEGERFSHIYRVQTAENEQNRVWEKGDGVFADGEAVALVGFVTTPPANVDEDVTVLCDLLRC